MTPKNASFTRNVSSWKWKSDSSQERAIIAGTLYIIWEYCLQYPSAGVYIATYVEPGESGHALCRPFAAQTVMTCCSASIAKVRTMNIQSNMIQFVHGGEFRLKSALGCSSSTRFERRGILLMKFFQRPESVPPPDWDRMYLLVRMIGRLNSLFSALNNWRRSIAVLCLASWLTGIARKRLWCRAGSRHGVSYRQPRSLAIWKILRTNTSKLHGHSLRAVRFNHSPNNNPHYSERSWQGHGLPPGNCGPTGIKAGEKWTTSPFSLSPPLVQDKSIPIIAEHRIVRRRG